MNDYQVFLKLRTDRQEAARQMRMRKFAQEAQETKEAKPHRPRFHFNLQFALRFVTRLQRQLRLARSGGSRQTTPCDTVLPVR